MSRISTIVAALSAVIVTPTLVDAITIKFTNGCKGEMQLFDSRSSSTIPELGSKSMNLPPNSGARTFRYGTGGQATLAEFSTDGGKVWYDISIIPTGNARGPGYCQSLSHCKQVTGGVGFNVGMKIIPSRSVGNGLCRTLTCLYDGCEDAYQYPKDDLKTHNCPLDTDFEVIFCPDRPVPTPTPTPTPVPTTPTPTPEPTTLAPTSSPTTQGPLQHVGFKSGSGSGSGSTIGISETRQAADEAAYIYTQQTQTVVETAHPPVVPVASNTPVQQANTRATGQDSTTVSLIVVGTMGFVAIIAGTAIYTIRKKKAQLEAIDHKSDDLLSFAEAKSMFATPREAISIL